MIEELEVDLHNNNNYVTEYEKYEENDNKMKHQEYEFEIFLKDENEIVQD